MSGLKKKGVAVVDGENTGVEPDTNVNASDTSTPYTRKTGLVGSSGGANSC